MDQQAIESRLRGDPSDAAAWEAQSEWLIQKGDPRGQLIRLSQLQAHAPVFSLRHATLGQEIERLSSECNQRALHLPKGAVAEWKYGFVVGLELDLHDTTAASLIPFLDSPDSCLLRSLHFNPESELGEDELEEEDYEDPGLINKPPSPLLATAAEALAALDLRNIRSLALPYCVIGAEATNRLLSSPQMGPLVSLDLRYAYIGDAGLQAIADLPHLAGLRSLWLQRNGITSKGIQSFAKSSHLRALRLLDLRYNRIGSKGAQALAKSPVVHELTTLHVFRKEIKKAGALALANSTQLPPALRRMWKAS